jgi:plasmid stabilization system protein ParE
MVKRTIIWTKTADLQLVGILEYWIKRNKSTIYSKKILSKVTERTTQIAISPEIYKKTDFANTRVASLGNFSIFYKTSDSEIIITAFWDNRQDFKRLFEILNSSELN